MNRADLRSAAPFVLAVLALAGLLFASVGGVSVFLAAQQNALAAQNGERMMRGGIVSLRSKVEMLAVDYSLRNGAVDRIDARDGNWMWSNMAKTVQEDTLDLLVAVYGDGAQMS